MRAVATDILEGHDSRRTAFLGLCVFSATNPIVTQLGVYFFPGGFAGRSVMQLYQGMYLLIVLVTAPLLCRHANALSRRYLWLLALFAVGLCVVYVRTWSVGRIPAHLASSERTVYIKIVAAFMLWYYATLLLRSHAQALGLLRALVFGGAVCAVWILFRYAAQGGDVDSYAYSGIHSTAGAEGVSGKAIAGFLLSAFIAMMYLSLRTSSCLRAVGAVLMLAAVFVTFDRSAQVACACVALSTAAWWYSLSWPKPATNTMVVLLVGLVLLGGLYVAHRGTDELVTRWTQDLDRGEIGSGRGSFYSTAWDWFVHQSSVGDFVLGMGFANIQELMFHQVGVSVHTHSDLFDMLLTGGLMGIVLYLVMHYVLFSSVIGVPTRSIEFAGMSALLIQFGVMSLITGQMSFPLTMYSFGAAFLCMRVLGLPEDGWETFERPSACQFDQTDHAAEVDSTAGFSWQDPGADPDLEFQST